MAKSVTGFAELPKLDLAKETQKIDLKIKRERLTSEKSNKESRLDAIIRADSGEIMGTISHDRRHVSYGELMGFITEQLESATLPFKLKDNVLTEKGELFQTYVFDQTIKGPDGSVLDPMFIVRSSYLHKLLDGKFGTYRFVCKNGVTVGNTISGISISSQQAGELARMSLRDQFELSFERFDRVMDSYKKMADVSLEKSLKELVTSERAPNIIKKGAIETLAQQGFITLVDKEGKIRMSVLEEEGPAAVYHIAKPGTRWDLYNGITDYLSHQSRSINAMMRGFDITSALFAA